ncbi:hypothetical protein KIN20_029588 [Parelaphostrongylus tenuis]|uniref:Uncharacterized protein n=1 Tax=Parelaphostrongylus tenuis TaxID=148309 RepID=A0AAD5R2S9_PARTN|nr:hypothetical protein KIN20_029588 [Parelaphostrongylus tenuis]
MCCNVKRAMCKMSVSSVTDRVRIPGKSELVVNDKISFDGFRVLVERTIQSNANPGYFSFVRETMPLFIDAIAHCTINVKWLLSCYFKPNLHSTRTRQNQDLATPSELPAVVSSVYFGSAPESGIYELHPIG